MIQLSGNDGKLNLAKRLYRKGYDRQAVINLLRFIDWLVNLPEGLEQSFWPTSSPYDLIMNVLDHVSANTPLLGKASI